MVKDDSLQEEADSYRYENFFYRTVQDKVITPQYYMELADIIIKAYLAGHCEGIKRGFKAGRKKTK